MALLQTMPTAVLGASGLSGNSLLFKLLVVLGADVALHASESSVPEKAVAVEVTC